MHAVVLVGGFGTRLRPLTFDIPKPLLPVGHVPLVQRVIETLATGGITDVTLALGFKPEPFVNQFPSNTCAGVNLHYAVEPEPLDTAGAIAFAAQATGITETFVVANGDVLTDLNVADLVALHRAKNAEATIHLIPVDDPAQYGVVETDADGHVLRFVEKPKPGESSSNVVNAGTYVFEPSILQLIPSNTRMSVEREVFPTLATRRTLFAMTTNDYWIDAGRPETYLQANLDLISGARKIVTEQVSANAQVASTATISNSVICAGAKIANGAVIKSSVILPGAQIGAHAVVVDSSVMGEVGANANVSGCLIGRTGAVASGVMVAAQLIPDPSSVV